MELRGGCYCGAVRYRATVDRRDVSTCYCSWCTRTVGSPLTAWLHVPAEGFEFTDGDPERFESSPGVLRTFCRRCGSSLTYHYPDRARVDVTTATLDDPAGSPPTRDGPGRPPWLRAETRS